MINNRRSIKFKTTAMLIFMLVLFAVILFTIIFTIGSYKKKMRFYTQSCHLTVSLHISASKFSQAVDKYISDCTESNGRAVSEAFSVFRDDLKALHSARFGLEDGQRREVEEINGELTVISASLNSILETDNAEDIRDVYKNALKSHMDIVNDGIKSVYDSIAEEGDGEYGRFNGRATFSQVIMIIFFIAFFAVSLYFVVYVKKRIAQPIADTCEWARIFKEGYCDMSDLKFNNEDEMTQLAESFNIVKANLVKANALKAEYESLMQKIHNDEEHKKKFVQQLYDEKREKEAISTVAKRDGLTGLYNRRTFDGIVDEFVSNKPSDAEGALFIIDMDNFKNVNDTLGHLAGDEALKTLAGAMRVVFNGAYLGRYGGDEFIVFIADYKSEEELEALAADLCSKMHMTFEHEGKSVGLSVSVGISTTVGVGEYSELYMMADKALYYSKENGRNQYKLASTLDDKTVGDV
ncbi:MAG: GGDEF domain-containing protein [Butyrivibrio sp.]|nr:GGDEF domain-containing protein [Butyrivibrio sp.]